MRAAVLLLTFGFAALQPGARDGRAGNRRLDAGDAPGAAEAYQAGIARRGVPAGIGARLWHNLGVALARDTTAASGPAPEPPADDSAGVSADSAFAQALRLADEPDQRARYAYDAGTAALLADDFERAAALLRRSLVLDPARPEARRNYEIARRRLDSRQNPPPTPEPSPEAQRLKARADALVAERRYREALDLMNDGLTRDSTVAAYQDFIGRLGGVVEIEEGPETTGPGAPVPAPPDAAAPAPAAPAGPTRL